MIDGVRAEQTDRKTDYEEFARRIIYTADHVWGNVCPFIFKAHTHQVGMLSQVIDEIRTPLLMYVEQDTPIVTDELIDWPAIITFLLEGRSNLVRLHSEAIILDAHSHMMHGAEEWHGRQFMRTSQWSQRPHVATVEMYRRALDQFTPNANCFIEDKMHGVCDEAYKIHGMAGWDEWRLHIYDHNDGHGNLKRSYHTDGRAGGPKFEGEQVF